MVENRPRSANCNLDATAGEKASYYPAEHRFYPVLLPSGLPIPARSLKCRNLLSRTPTRACACARIWC